jgi:3-hydroxy acid dehydrogenase/malonic semialdehyde reductase
MENNLASHTIFITGASSGFGEACARILSKNGAKIIISGRRKDRLEKLQQQLGGPNKVHYLQLDVRDKQQVIDKINNLPPEFSDITILINNAGLALGLEPAQDCNINDWETMIATNINGVLYCTHSILPLMVKKNNGYIINIGSVAGNYPYPGANVYGATKAFLRQFSLNLRADLVGKNIRVTNIEPGNAETEFSVVRFKGDQQKASNVYAGTESIAASDIAETILWCITRPAHININAIEIMPTCQAFSPFTIKRGS